MGFSSFVGGILGGRGVKTDRDSTQSVEPLPLRTPRRRRGIMRDRDRMKDRDRDISQSEEKEDRSGHTSYRRSSPIGLQYRPAARTSWDDPCMHKKSEVYNVQRNRDMEDSDETHDDFTVSSRSRHGWRKIKNSSRIKSNLEDTLRIRDASSTRSRDLQPTTAATEKDTSTHVQAPATRHNFHYRSQYPSRRRESEVDGPPSFKKFFMRATMNAHHEPCISRQQNNAGTEGSEDSPSPPYYRRPGRIRSNLDQLMRRDKDAFARPMAASRSSGKRRHSLFADAPIQSCNVEEPKSLCSGSVRDSKLTQKDGAVVGLSPVPCAQTHATPPTPASHCFSTDLVKRDLRLMTAKMTSNGEATKPSSASSASTGIASVSTGSSTSTTSVFPSWEGARSLEGTTPFSKKVSSPIMDFARGDEEQIGTSHRPKKSPGRINILESRTRFSADDAYPNRPKEAPLMARSRSNPASAAQESVVPKRAPKKRPPPLRTPTDNATGFACGVGLNSGIRRVPLGRSSCDSTEEAADLRNVSSVTVDTTENRSEISAAHQRNEHRRSFLHPSESGSKFSLDGRESTRFDIWSPETSQNHFSGHHASRVARQLVDKDEDLFRFEEASQSSFGDVDSPSRFLPRDSVVSLGGHRGFAEVLEDHFVFGADGSFSDGGFIISSNGLLEAPERLMRKTSDGATVEGVPTSSNNIIFVKSLDEFRKSYTFRSSPSDETSTLGRGSAGRVYLASHRPTGRKIAVKEINVYDEEKRKQLRKELQTLINHQSRFLVRSFGAFYDGAGVVHVTLEFMDRGSLADIVLQRGRIPEPVVCKLMEHCLRGLAFLHENHILHRDVKTANILLSRKLCRAKLSDFGLARDFEVDNKSRTDSFVGTLAYMSPERLHGRIYTYASDIWSIGIIVMECVMGKFPFDKPQSYFDIVDAAQSDPAFLMQNEEISSECFDFIRLCLHSEMDDRPTARELLQHEWIRSRMDDANVLREWFDTIPRLHCEDVEVGSELAFNAEEKQRERLKAKAKNFL